MRKEEYERGCFIDKGGVFMEPINTISDWKGIRVFGFYLPSLLLAAAEGIEIYH